MKTTIILLLALFVIGCSNDNPVSNNTPSVDSSTVLTIYQHYQSDTPYLTFDSILTKDTVPIEITKQFGTAGALKKIGNDTLTHRKWVLSYVIKNDHMYRFEIGNIKFTISGTGTRDLGLGLDSTFSYWAQRQ